MSGDLDLEARSTTCQTCGATMSYYAPPGEAPSTITCRGPINGRPQAWASHDIRRPS